MTKFDPNDWTDVINLAYQYISDARKGVHDAIKAETEAKSALESDRKTLIINGIAGKNAEEREANLRDALSERYTALETAAAVTASERLSYDLASFEVDRIKLTIRALELEDSQRREGAK